ncbi:hypothetical protein HGM15179_002033, partial [Zosterops borbonicus]
GALEKGGFGGNDDARLELVWKAEGVSPNRAGVKCLICVWQPYVDTALLVKQCLPGKKKRREEKRREEKRREEKRREEKRKEKKRKEKKRKEKKRKEKEENNPEPHQFCYPGKGGG